MTHERRGWSSLTAHEVVHQSYLIHPDWTTEMHAWYLVAEEGFHKEYVQTLPVLEWLEQLAGE